MIKVVYIAGPYGNDIPGNTADFKKVALKLWKAGFVAINPVANADYMSDVFNEEVFRERGAILVKSADAVLLRSGWQKSTGACMEHDSAIDAGIPVFESLEKLIEYAGDVASEETRRANQSILQEAQSLTTGDRNRDYGHPLDDYTKTSKLWSVILGKKLKEDITAEEAILCMIAVKISREVHMPRRDNRVDGAGYFNVLDMCILERTRREKDG